MDQTAVNGVSFELSDDQKMLQKLARDFAAKEIIPVAEHFDKTAEFPIDIINKGRNLGLVNLNIPEEYGGPGAKVFDEVIVQEELGYGCSGISTAMSVNNLSSLPIMLGGTEQQRVLARRNAWSAKAISSAYCVTGTRGGA
ncbi:MAG: acyl-CoA dehydrogenase family protein [Chloroflexi bacterium]|uniref:acyl-CoA dehydrogenase family protein n=1 Tax=Candidatus Flexifilum breve TaxID=3140694 RepID=UPI0031346A41|nr:acyl-CoA dehydrogenase family protein [Chloroflexota bacterium]